MKTNCCLALSLVGIVIVSTVFAIPSATVVEPENDITYYTNATIACYGDTVDVEAHEVLAIQACRNVQGSQVVVQSQNYTMAHDDTFTADFEPPSGGWPVDNSYKVRVKKDGDIIGQQTALDQWEVVP